MDLGYVAGVYFFTLFILSMGFIVVDFIRDERRGKQ